MNILIDKSFEKDTDKIKDKKLLSSIANIIEEIKECKLPTEIKNIKKIKGSQQHYRIHKGNYRIGLTIVGDGVTFLRFLDRKDIYKYFP
jgi:mRNA interferase RelE/StbE